MKSEGQTDGAGGTDRPGADTGFEDRGRVSESHPV